MAVSASPAKLIAMEEHVYPEVCIVEDHAVKRHAIGCLLNASELQKSIVLALSSADSQ